MSKNANSLGSFIIGSVLGLVAGMILAPKKNSKIREKIGEKTEDLKDMLCNFIKSFSRKVKNIKSDFGNKWVKTKSSTTNKVDDCIENELGT